MVIWNSSRIARREWMLRRPVPSNYPLGTRRRGALARRYTSLVLAGRGRLGRNPVPVDLFSPPAIQPNFLGPGTETSPPTFQVTGRNFRVGGRSFCVGRALPGRTCLLFRQQMPKDFECGENRRVGSSLGDGDGRGVFPRRAELADPCRVTPPPRGPAG
jgi:hypothetical protein